MIWYYFAIEDGALCLVGDEFFSDRPAHANECGSNPHTPWYQTEDHYDSNHIHIRAANAECALIKALGILESC